MRSSEPRRGRLRHQRIKVSGSTIVSASRIRGAIRYKQTKITPTRFAAPEGAKASAKRLKRCGDGRHRPLWHQLFDLTRQPVASEFGVLDGMDIILQHDLLRRMIEAYRGQPTSIRQRPGPSPSINPVMTKEKALQMLPCLGQHPDRCCPGSHQ